MNSDGVIIFIIILAIVIIWLIIKLNKTIELNKKLNFQILSLESKNNKLHNENILLVGDNAMLEAEHLKFQLQPHTLGNVVATLNAIVKNLHRGTESLAESLNYILYRGNTHLVSVEEEISFIKKFIQLNQFLNSDIVSANLDDTKVDKESMHYNLKCIPHLISAYLVENAYKHGDKTHPDFLKITLKLTDYSFEMVLVNRIASKQTKSINGGLGLVNMRKRLELLLGGKYELKCTVNEQEYHSSLIILL